MSLLGMEPLTDMIKLVLQSAYVEGSLYPVSLFIIARPESAKTASMEQFKIEGTYTTNNITQSVIVSDILPMIENKGLKHIIIPDILNATEKDTATKKGFMNMMKTLMEEGITSLDTFNMRSNKVYNPPVKCGVITGITTESYHGTFDPEKGRMIGGLKRYLRITGILSRFTPFSYKYKHEKILKIFEYIQDEEYKIVDEKANYGNIVRTPKVITGDARLFKLFEMTCSTIGRESGGYGIRLQRTFQNLAKANAMLHKRRKVIRKDIDKILELSNWINYDFNPL